MSTYNKRNFKSYIINYKEGQYIKCINNIGDSVFKVLQNYTAIGLPGEYNIILNLTIGKIYKVISHDYDVIVENDLGIKESYNPSYFREVSLEEWRDVQIGKLLK